MLSSSLAFLVAEVSSFSVTAEGLSTVLASKALEIENAKKAALGQQILVQSEAENRRREQTRLQYMLLETKAQTQRFVLRYSHAALLVYSLVM